ncbi:MAG: calcium/sodium antiporter [Lachnospiraceae bacterium]|nr:calcium/sodium antiporter [Lachnospiraceae bacterium]
MDMLIQVLILVLGFVMLVKGADWFVDGAAGVADKLGVPQLVIGLTIVAMGTSAPEAAVSLTAALKGNADIALGNVVGSNILNILIILGIVSVIIATPISKSIFKVDLPFMLVMSLLVMLLGYMGEDISRLDGGILLVFFVGYLVYLFVDAKKSGTSNEEEKEENNKPIWQLILIAVVGLVLIVFGSDFTVDAATKIATELGMGTKFIGLTIVALGTSLPELFTSVAAALKGKSDIAIGNIVGSNIFNILFILGTSSVITPINFEPIFLIDALVSVGAGVLLWVMTFKKKHLTRPAGITMLLCYAGYFVYLIMG